jgi:hypothetical protein
MNSGGAPQSHGPQTLQTSGLRPYLPLTHRTNTVQFKSQIFVLRTSELVCRSGRFTHVQLAECRTKCFPSDRWFTTKPVPFAATQPVYPGSSSANSIGMISLFSTDLS